MKPERNLKQITLITFFYVISLTADYAQIQELESSDFPSAELIELTSNETEEKASKLLLNSEKDSISRSATVKTKLNIESSKTERIKDEPEKEDSILSFNFIYYIIKKFKFSDIVDH